MNNAAKALAYLVVCGVGAVGCLSSDSSAESDAGASGGGSGTGGSAGTGGTAASGGTAGGEAVEIDLTKILDAPSMVDDGSGDPMHTTFDGKYRDDLTRHAGCAKRGSYDANLGLTAAYGANEATVPAGQEANLPGYDCAAKDYAVTEDASKPIVLLVHGNSETVNAWEEWGSSNPADGKGGYQTTSSTLSEFVFTTDPPPPRTMLATKLVGQGFRTIAVDFRIDKVADLGGFDQVIDDKSYENPSRNIDHGWTVPILQSLLKAVIVNYPERRISLVGHSLGVTTVRDAIRRLFVAYLQGEEGAVNPLPHLQDVILLHGANHGVSTFATCGANYSMRGTVTCQMGAREGYNQSDFHKPLNGSNDAFATPCADGVHAFGGNAYGEATDVCGGNTIKYTTITIEDTGVLQDEFVSQASAKLNAPQAANLTITKSDFDSSGYFFGGLFANHYAGPRSNAGMAKVMELLGD